MFSGCIERDNWHEMLKAVLNYFAKFTGKSLQWIPATLYKVGLHRRCFFKICEFFRIAVQLHRMTAPVEI